MTPVPTLDSIKNVLRQTSYVLRPDLLDDWAIWLHEEYHVERPELRHVVFNTLMRLF